MARPRTYNIEDMIAKIEQYTDAIEIPVLKEVCYLNHWNYDYVMQLQRDNEELSQSIKELLCKKEVVLEKGMLTGLYSASGCIFSLKQLGWKDKVELGTDESIGDIKVSIETPKEEDYERVKRLKEGLFKSGD